MEFLYSIVYLVIHLLLYLLVLRYQPRFRNEVVILGYHLISAIALSIILISVIILQLTTVAIAMGVLSLHGIYSLSFLELWALADGSYSIKVLDRVWDSQNNNIPLNVAELENIGSSKKGSRIQSLEKLGMIKNEGLLYVLTLRGKIMGFFLYLLVVVANLNKLKR